jgi:hypothetical protein
MTAITAKSFLGRWRITYMEEWDQDYVDLVTPGFIEFNQDDSGKFQFGTVRGFLDCRVEKRGRECRIEFSWDGQNDTDPGCGRGWAVIEQGQLSGHLYIHMGDDSEFVAEKVK